MTRGDTSGHLVSFLAVFRHFRQSADADHRTTTRQEATPRVPFRSPLPWARWDNQQGASDAGFEVSQRKRKLNEEIFGWGKVVGGLRKMRVAGRWKIQQLTDIALATLNMVRMRTLLAT